MQSTSQKNTVAIYTEIDLCMTVLYLLLESQRHQSSSESSQKFKQDLGKVLIDCTGMWLCVYLMYALVTLEPNLTEFLLLLTSRLRERLPDKSFPTRKVEIGIRIYALIKLIFSTDSAFTMEIHVVHV